MPNVTVLGANSSVITIAVASSAAAAAAQTALNLISTSIASGTGLTAVTYNGTLPTTLPSSVNFPAGGVVTIPAGSAIGAITNSAPSTLLNVANNATGATTVVSGPGGISYQQGGNFTVNLVAGGGTEFVNLLQSAAAGTSTVVADTGNANSTIQAFFGSTVLNITGANQTSGFNQIGIGGSDTVSLSGANIVGSQSETGQVTLAAGSVNYFNTFGTSLLTTASSGVEVVGVFAGSTVSVTGVAGATILEGGSSGNLVINPGAANVTIFGATGSTTLYGTGDSSFTNTGSDYVVAGLGQFHGGSGGINVLIGGAASASTLIGGGTADYIYANAAGSSLRGGAGTQVLDAAVVNQGGISVAGAQNGVVINASAAANAVIIGSLFGSNTIISGSGSATVTGFHGASTVNPVGNIYQDGKSGGTLVINDFLANVDKFQLLGATATAFAPTGSGGTTVTLSDATKVTFVNQTVTQANSSSYFS